MLGRQRHRVRGCDLLIGERSLALRMLQPDHCFHTVLTVWRSRAGAIFQAKGCAPRAYLNPAAVGCIPTSGSRPTTMSSRIEQPGAAQTMYIADTALRALKSLDTALAEHLPRML